MSSEEFLDRFDVLFNNVASNQAPGLNVYEVCVFLTKAQDEKLKNYFNPKGNKYGEGFDGNQKRQIDFSMITKIHNVSTFSAALYDPRSNSKNSVINFPLTSATQSNRLCKNSAMPTRHRM